MSTNPLFISGTSRGGTNLAIMMLSVNPLISISQDPFLALYKSYNNKVLRDNGVDANDLFKPLDEYYYYDEKIHKMNLIQESNINTPFKYSELEELKMVIAERMKLSSPLLIPHLGSFHGKNYFELFNSALEIVRLGRDDTDLKWLGFNDNWTTEFFKPLSRSYQNAKFISIIRDVRGAVASHVKLVEATHTNPLYQYDKDVSMLALTISFVRCWRKHVAFTYKYLFDEEFNDRVLMVKYEDLVLNPRTELKNMCEFLKVEYLSDMIDTNHFISPDGGKWLPNSNQGNVPQSGIFTSSIDKWKESLSSDMLDLIELVAGPDLEMCGYETSRTYNPKMILSAYGRHKSEDANWKGGGWGWRTDNRNPEIDISFELLRRSAINNTTDNDLIEQLFLFPIVYENILKSSK